MDKKYLFDRWMQDMYPPWLNHTTHHRPGRAAQRMERVQNDVDRQPRGDQAAGDEMRVVGYMFRLVASGNGS